MADYGLPQYCPIDGSKLEPPDEHDDEDNTYACDLYSHNWEISFRDREFYTLELTGY